MSSTSVSAGSSPRSIAARDQAAACAALGADDRSLELGGQLGVAQALARRTRSAPDRRRCAAGRPAAAACAARSARRSPVSGEVVDRGTAARRTASTTSWPCSRSGGRWWPCRRRRARRRPRCSRPRSPPRRTAPSAASRIASSTRRGRGGGPAGARSLGDVVIGRRRRGQAGSRLRARHRTASPARRRHGPGPGRNSATPIAASERDAGGDQADDVQAADEAVVGRGDDLRATAAAPAGDRSATPIGLADVVAHAARTARRRPRRRACR